MPRPPREPSELVAGKLRVPVVSMPDEEEEERSTEELLAEIVDSLRKLRELLAQVVEELQESRH